MLNKIRNLNLPEWILLKFMLGRIGTCILALGI